MRADVDAGERAARRAAFVGGAGGSLVVGVGLVVVVVVGLVVGLLVDFVEAEAGREGVGAVVAGPGAREGAMAVLVCFSVCVCVRLPAYPISPPCSCGAVLLRARDTNLRTVFAPCSRSAQLVAKSSDLGISPRSAPAALRACVQSIVSQLLARSVALRQAPLVSLSLGVVLALSIAPGVRSLAFLLSFPVFSYRFLSF
jgi:hypothetical protein